MELTQSTLLEVPLWHLELLLVLMIACLAMRRYVLGLLGAILFTMYWGYICNLDKFLAQPLEFNYSTVWFIFTGVITALLVVALAVYTFSLKE
ncbi:MAG: hypothetical protein R3339_07525 [Thermodesulfobacteriota bacterium]|nr:hypothetical protein [Thermodesulfobacteriota bacterium]